MHYNKPETRLIATYSVTDTSNPTPLFIGMESAGFPASAIYDKIEIDDVEIDMSDLSSSEQEGATIYSYGFEIDGQHTVKYTLKDPTMIGAEVDEETHMPSKVGATFGTCPITSVEIPDSVTSISQTAFAGCSGLTSITIPDSVTSIGDGAFDGCSSLTSVIIPDSVISIDDYAFRYCSGLTSVIIPDSVTSIGSNAFDYCSGLTSVTIGSGITSISDNIFNNCRSLTSITIPDSVTSIGAYAFMTCSGLTSVTIPDGVTSIGDGAFIYCRSLSSVTIEATTPPTLGSSAFNSTNNCPIYVPSASVNTYKAASGWSTYASRIHEIGGGLVA